MYTRSYRAIRLELPTGIRPVCDLSGPKALQTASRAKPGRSEHMQTVQTGGWEGIPRKYPSPTCLAVSTPIGWRDRQVWGRYGDREDRQADMERPSKTDLDTPWDELTDEQKDRAVDWAGKVMELSRRVDRFEQELDNALERQEMTEMEKASAEMYRALGHPEGYRYRGGPVGWDGVGA